MKLLHIGLMVAMGIAGFSTDAAGQTSAQRNLAQIAAMDERSVFSNPEVVELARAVSRGDVRKIQALALPQTLTAKGRDDVILLEWAVLNQQAGSLQALLDKGANPAVHGLDGQTVLHMAAQMRNSAYLNALLARRVSPNLPARDGSSALINALHAEERGNLQILLNAGADPNQADVVGSTPLHVAARIYDYDSVMMLLENGANPGAVNRAGFTFQKYLAPDEYVPLNANGKRKLARIHDWLRANGIAIEEER